MYGARVLTVKRHASDLLYPDDCKSSVLLIFHINSTPIWRLGNLASIEASIDYTALRMKPRHSWDYELSFGTSLAKVGHNGCKILGERKRTEQFGLLFFIYYFYYYFLLATKVNNTECYESDQLQPDG